MLKLSKTKSQSSETSQGDLEFRDAGPQPSHRVMFQPGLDADSCTTSLVAGLDVQGLGLPVAQKTYHFKEVYIETIIRSHEKVGVFGYR